MKLIFKISIAFTLLAWGLNARAQQEPQYTQYMYNMMAVNPAYTGTRPSLNALLLSRVQWAGLAGAPRSHTFALHTPLKNQKMGLGGSVIADRIGPVVNTYITANYAYRVNLSEKLTLSMGLKAGIYNYHVQLTDVETGGSDPAFEQDISKRFRPNLGTGLFLYSSKYYAGVSVPSLLNTVIGEEEVSGDETGKLRRHYFLTGGYVFNLGENWTLKPSVLSKLVVGSPPSVDLTAQAFYRESLWLGSTYRVGDAIALLFGVRVSKSLIVGYSYDITISELSRVSDGSHEILLSFDFAGFSTGKVKSPRYF